jgi:glycerol-3-phosphate dehydrogenase (NAD(P)+)
MSKVAIVGTTTWGLTLARMLARKGVGVRMLARTEEEIQRLDQEYPAHPKIGKIKFPKLKYTTSAATALNDANAVLLVVPSQSMRENIRWVAPFLNKSMLIISASKGIEIETGRRLSQVISEEIDPRFRYNITVLSGPNLYAEILKDLPAVSVVAGYDEGSVNQAQKLLNAPNFCVYTNTDVIGVELGGALKNIIALGAGMVDGLGYGDNAKSALITRGLTEISALGVTLGANPLTFSGLSGLGDLVATCASPLSRNHYVGEALAKGYRLSEVLESMESVAEGVATTSAAWKLSQQLGLEMPITQRIHRVLYEDANPETVITEMLGAQGRHELYGRRWNLASLFRKPKKRG